MIYVLNFIIHNEYLESEILYQNFGKEADWLSWIRSSWFSSVPLAACRDKDKPQIEEKKEPTDDPSIDVYSQWVNSTCFGHHIAHRQENRLYKTASGVSLDVLAAVVWGRDTSWEHCNTCIHTVRSAHVPTPHNRSQHIQANTIRSFIRSVLLTMGMMPETCWELTCCE